MAIFPGSAIPSAVSDDYEIDNSLRFNDNDGYLRRTFPSAGNQESWTWSGWVKKAKIDAEFQFFATDYSDSANYMNFKLRASHGTESKNYTCEVVWVISSTTRILATTQKFRDCGAWMHICLVCDTPNSTAANRLRLYVNGEEVTAFDTDDRSGIGQNDDLPINRAGVHDIGGWNGSGDASGYLAEVYFIDGTALTPSSFGETDSTTNQWIPLDSDDVKDAVTFGANGFYQKYNSTELAASFVDSSGGFMPTAAIDVEYLIVGGGGGAGRQLAGGGGAGGYRTNVGGTAISLTSGVNYTVTVGAGGAGSPDISSTTATNGGDSSISGSGLTTITASGGGAGSSLNAPGVTGGSGGGGAIYSQAGGAGNSGGYSPVEGYAGGTSSGTSSGGGGGGGGASEVGENADGPSGGDGGDGVANSITGASVTYAGGGGGGARTDGSHSGVGGSGGSGGGGAGTNDNSAPVAGTDGLGGGGGASGYYSGSSNGADGGSGVVIISYISTTAKAVGGTITSYTSGSDTYQVHTFTASAAPHTITANGDATNQRPQYHDVTAYGNAHLIGPKVGTSVAEFQGTTSDRLSVAASSDFNFGTGDWTVEVFANKDQDLDASIYRFGDGSPLIELIIDENDKPKWYVENTSGTGYSADGSDGDTELNRWYHLAAVKSGTTLTFYLNGVSKATATGLSGDFGNSTDTTDIGSRGSSEKAFGGYMDSLRVSNSARYTANFTPPTTSFTNDSNTKLLIQNGTDGSQTFTDGSSSSHTITVNGDVRWFAPKIGAGAMAFDGSSAYSVADSPDYDFDDGPFTVETWVKFNTVGSADIVTKYDDHPTIDQRSWGIKYPDADNLEFRYSTNGSSWAAEMTFSWTPSANTWYHIAVTRDSSSDIRAFVDGTQIGSTTNVTADFYSSTALLVLGADMSYGSINTGNGLDGVMGPTRISKGVARYTANFTAPTTLFTDAINDTLIANADINHGTWNPDTSTGLAISTDSRMKFDGSGDYLECPDSTDWDFGTGAFCLEAWVYLGATSTYYDIFSTAAADDNQGIIFYIDGSEGEIKAKIGDGSSWTVQIGSAGDIFTANEWHHVALVREGTGSNELKIYLDGTSVAQGTYSDSDADNNTDRFRVGLWSISGWYWNGYMDEVRVSNVARYTAAFTPTRTQFTADSNTKLLIHSDWTGGLGADSSGNYNNFTATNLVATDQMVDTPTNSFCTLNPLVPVPSSPTLTEGNLKGVYGSGWSGDFATWAVESGKFYCEFLLNAITTNVKVGVMSINEDFTASGPQDRPKSLWYNNEGTKFQGGGTATAYGASYTAGDIVGIALDKDGNTLTFYKNGSSQGELDLTSFNVGTDSLTIGNAANNVTTTWNFGADSSFAGAKTAQGNQDGNGKGDFYYEPPSGYLALCTDNLSDPEIKLPGENFTTHLFTGNDTASNAQSIGFQPDLVWLKERDGTAFHGLFDSVRGRASGISSNDTMAASTSPAGDDLASFDSNGFTVGEVNDWNSTNKSGALIVAWNWLAGGAPTADNSAGAGATPTAGSVKINGSNLGSALAGSIAATRLSANTESGFSIVQYEGTEAVATVAHGLSQAPELILFKNIDSALFWPVYNKTIDATDYLILNDTSASLDSDGYFNDAEPTPTVFSLGDKTNLNRDTCIAYCFHSVEGYSKVFEWDGNSSTDGVFTYLGFTPAFCLLKCYSGSSTQEWVMFDNKRNTYNVVNNFLYANDSAAESSSASRIVDFVSNGLKFRGNDGATNTSGRSYIGYAVASHPFKFSNAR